MGFKSNHSMNHQSSILKSPSTKVGVSTLWVFKKTPIIVSLCSPHTGVLAMMCKRPKPMIRKLSELLVSGNRVTVDAVVTSPRSPLDFKNIQMQSPRGFKNYEAGGVGLGIVVALGHESLPKHAVCSSRNLQRSDPIPVHQPNKSSDGFRRGCCEIHLGAAGSLENYTYVTYRVPNETFTKVYYNGSEVDRRRRHNNVCLPSSVEEDETSLPTSDFLTSCHLCGKKLHGKDIYMYRGETGFCSNECRSRQILMEERKEKCRSEASRSVEMASSPAYTRRQIFAPGILVI